jgi:hypothetical protein
LKFSKITTGNGTEKTGCGTNWVRHQLGAAQLGAAKPAYGKWVRLQPILALKNQCFLQICFNPLTD